MKTIEAGVLKIEYFEKIIFLYFKIFKINIGLHGKKTIQRINYVPITSKKLLDEFINNIKPRNYSGYIDITENDLIKNSKKFKRMCKQCKFFVTCTNNRKVMENSYKNILLKALRLETCDKTQIKENYINSEIKILELTKIK